MLFDQYMSISVIISYISIHLSDDSYFFLVIWYATFIIY